MWRTILKYGVIAGLVVGGLEGITVATFSGMPPLKYGMWIGYTTMLIALSAVFVGIKQHRDVDRGGVIGFWRAFGIGVGISFIAGIFYVAAWGNRAGRDPHGFRHVLFARDDRGRKGERRERRGAGEADRRHGALQGAIRRSDVPLADDLYRDLPRRRAGVAGLGGAAAQQPFPAAAKGSKRLTAFGPGADISPVICPC